MSKHMLNLGLLDLETKIDHGIVSEHVHMSYAQIYLRGHIGT